MTIGRVEFVGYGPQQVKPGDIVTTNEEYVQWFNGLEEFTVNVTQRGFYHYVPDPNDWRTSLPVRTEGTEYVIMDSDGRIDKIYYDINDDSWIDFIEYNERR